MSRSSRGPRDTPTRGTRPGARVAKALTWVGLFGDRQHLRPAGENLVVTVDLDTATVLAVEDDELVPLPPRAGNYAPELASDAGNFPPEQRPAMTCARSRSPSPRVRASRSRATRSVGRNGICSSASARRGPGPAPGALPRRDRERSVLYRASLSEMWVPYGDPAPCTGSRRCSTRAKPGSARWPTRCGWAATAWARSATSTRSSPMTHGEPVRLDNAICIHEEDTGIGWKHTQPSAGRSRSGAAAGW